MSSMDTFLQYMLMIAKALLKIGGVSLTISFALFLIYVIMKGY